ncbi:hypothetical protein L6269_00745 [Candidatus Dependentiae bacterium]|nr:hypothetical protein [Candidatus Dependentiae bacterium]
MDSTFSIVDKLTFPLQSKISYVSYGANVFNGYGILSSKVIDQETKIDVFEGMNYSLKNMAEFLRKEFSGLSYADISVIFKILARSIDTKNCKIVSKKGIAFVLLPILGAFLKNYYNPQLADEIEGNVQRGLSYLCVAKKNLFSWTNILGIKTKKDAKNFNTYQSEYFTYEKINFEDICNSMINDIEKYNTYNDTIKNKAISKINRFKDAFKEMIKDDEYDFITAYNKWLAGKTKTFEYKAWKGSTCEYKEISYDTLIADKDVYKYIKEINELKNKEEEKF